MTDLERMRQEVDARKSKMTGDVYMSRANLKLREWDILTTVCRILRECGEEVPISATEGEAPDFIGTWLHGDCQTPIEVTEALDPDYRRGDFWKRASSPNAPKSYSVGPPLDEPWLPLRARVSDKSQKGYGHGAWLIVYYNISGLKLPDWETSFEDQLIAEHSREPFSGLAAFERVLVLSCGMDLVVQLAPTPRVFSEAKKPQ